MESKQQNYMPVIGVQNAHFAHKNNESEYETPMLFEGVKQIGIKPKVQNTPINGDNRLLTQLSDVPTVEVDISMNDLTDEQENYLLGHDLDETGGMIYCTNDHAPAVALLFESPKANGEMRYCIFYEGQFEPYSEDIKGQDGKTTPSVKKLKGTFRPTATGLYKHQFDSDSKNVTQDKIDNFFKKVYIPKKLVKQETPVNTGLGA